jgi:hypothetical protein
MILPTKRLGVERAMLTVGAEILGLLTERIQRQRERMPCISVCLRQATKPYHEH